MSQSFGGALAPAATQTISFSEIPYNIQVPGTYYEVRPNFSQAGLLSYPARALIIAQMLSTGTAAPNTPNPIFSPSQALGLFGNGSIAGQCAAAFIAANPYLPLDVIGVSDATGAVAATASVTIAGAATQAGTLALYFGGKRVAVPVNAGDALATVSTNLQDTYGDLTSPPFSQASGAAGVMEYTFLNKGTLGNGYDIRLNAQPGDVTPPGLTVTITPFSGGATDPTIAAALAKISSAWYTDVFIPFNDPTNVQALESVAAQRYTALGKMDVHVYRAISGTPATMQTAQASYNSQFASVLGVQNPLEPTWVWGASFAGVSSYNLANDPSRQLRDLALPGVTAPASEDILTLTERNILLGAGISTFDVQSDGTVTLERVVTENLTSSEGVPDKSWHDIMVPKTMSRIRYDWVGYVSLTYPRNKLADDGTLAAEFDPTVVTPSRLQSSWAGRSRVYAELGWIEHSTALAKQAVFTRDLSDPNRVNARQQVQIIGNLMVLAGSLEFSL